MGKASELYAERLNLRASRTADRHRVSTKSILRIKVKLLNLDIRDPLKGKVFSKAVPGEWRFCCSVDWLGLGVRRRIHG